MSLAAEERYDVVAYRIEKAYETMKQVRGVLPMRYWALIANRLFYAAYYAVSALLIAHGHRVKSHEGTVTQFGLHFAKRRRCHAPRGADGTSYCSCLWPFKGKTR